jgi:EAL domain-containing protein (putative c-di-GMP-specific phosphodiesterase class I)
MNDEGSADTYLWNRGPLKLKQLSGSAKTLPQDWLTVVTHLKHAFQPIVDLHDGNCIGYEALLRNYEEAGFASIDTLFDAAHEDNVLYDIDIMLRQKALEQFIRVDGHKERKLFYNLDGRILDGPVRDPYLTINLVHALGLGKESLCFEVSEKQNFNQPERLRKLIKRYQCDGFSTALDDYGTGYAGLKTLCNVEPTFIKIDGFFIHGESTHFRKTLFRHLLPFFHDLGSKVIAEGIETESELEVCRTGGFDYAQGYLIQKPTMDISELHTTYLEVL